MATNTEGDDVEAMCFQKLKNFLEAHRHIGEGVSYTANLMHVVGKSGGGLWTAEDAAEGARCSGAFVAFAECVEDAFRHLRGAAEDADVGQNQLAELFAEMWQNPSAIIATAAAEAEVRRFEDACNWLKELVGAWVVSGDFDQDYHLEVLQYDHHGLQVVYITNEVTADQQQPGVKMITTSLDHLVKKVIANNAAVEKAAKALACAFGRRVEEEWSRKFARALWAQVEAAHLLHQLVAHALLPGVGTSLKVPTVKLYACKSLASVRMSVAAYGRLLAAKEAAGEDEGGKAAGGSDEADPDAGSVPQPQASA